MPAQHQDYTPKLYTPEREERATALLKRVGMGERLDHVPSQLSGGEQQRVTIARAISNKPALLLLDEPTGDLDSVNTCIVMQQLLELNKKENITLVMVTHDVGLKEFADRVIWMSDGKIKYVEKVDPQKQQQRVQKLQEDTNRIMKGEKPLYVHFNHTFVRKPTDYQTHPRHDPKKVQKKEFVFDEKYKSLGDITLEEYEEKLLRNKDDSRDQDRDAISLTNLVQDDSDTTSSS